MDIGDEDMGPLSAHPGLLRFTMTLVKPCLAAPEA